MYYFLSLVCFLLFSCSAGPGIKYDGQIDSNNSLHNKDILVFEEYTEIIDNNYTVIGKIKIYDANSFRCNFDIVISEAKHKTRQVGGDAFVITKLLKPDIWSTCYRIEADVISFHDKLNNNSMYEDVIHLKNGSTIYGLIIEQKPNEYIKIKSGKNIFVYQIDEIDIITKELLQIKPTYKDYSSIYSIKENTFSLTAGLLDQGLNVQSIGKDILFSDKIYGSIAAGYPSNYINLGIKYIDDYNEDSFFWTWSGGYYVDSWGDLQLTFQTSPGYQFRLGQTNMFLKFGLSGGFRIDTWDSSVYPIVAPLIVLSGKF